MIQFIKRLTWCDIYVILYVSFTLANLFIQTSVATLGTYTPMLLILIIFFVKSIFNRNNTPYIQTLIFFIFFLSIYGIIHWIGGETLFGVKPTSFLYGNFMSLAPILLFYLCSLQGKIPLKRMQIYFIVLLCLSITEFINYLYLRNIFDLTEESKFTNNTAYLFVQLLPLLFLFRNNRIIQYAFLVVLMYFTMSAMKRGAILILAIFTLFFIFVSNKSSSKKEKKNFILTLLFLIFLGIAIHYLVNKLWINNQYFQSRLELTSEGNSNGRDIIFSKLWDNFNNLDNIFYLLFGIGAEGTIRIIQMHAHNDWLELLTNCGIVGVTIYIIYFLRMLGDCKRFKNVKPEVYIIMSCFLILFMRSLFSMSYMDMSLAISAALGYGIGVCEKRKKTILYKTSLSL